MRSFYVHGSVDGRRDATQRKRPRLDKERDRRLAGYWSTVFGFIEYASAGNTNRATSASPLVTLTGEVNAGTIANTHVFLDAALIDNAEFRDCLVKIQSQAIDPA